MDTKQTHTPFDEIIMRAWVAGWSDAIAGSMNDDNKRKYTRRALAKHPECQAAPALLAALKECSDFFIAIDNMHPERNRGSVGRHVRDLARAAIALAEKD